MQRKQIYKYNKEIKKVMKTKEVKRARKNKGTP